ncbi:MAG: chorismate-binding protein, partial [Myxococcota bacterium]
VDRESSGSLSARRPVPVRSALGLLAAAPAGDLRPTFFWRDEDGVVIGLGEAERVEASGPARLARVEAELEARVRARPELVSSRWFGGFSFEDEIAPGPFAPFGSVRFVRPRFAWTLDRSGTRAAITGDPYVSASEWAEVLDWATSAVEEPRPLAAGSAEVEAVDPVRWQHALEAAFAAFAAGSAQKIVLSRDLIVRRRGGFPPAAVLAGLPARSSAEAAFAFFAEREIGPAGLEDVLSTRREACFLGLTPERLLRVEPGRVRSEALAGTSSPTDPDGLALLESDKDREEHAYVVEHLRERIARFAAGPVQVPSAPSVRRLGTIAHLLTPIEARSASTPPILSLAESLHPSPAVGGVPLGTARDVIRTAENRPRGWYSGGVGWLELGPKGPQRGELRVALRSALLDGREARVSVGAGVVPASTVEGEWRETALKARRTLLALGGRVD